MSVETVREYFKQWGRAGDILEFPVSSATVELAAQALHVAPARIAKTLSFQGREGCILIITAGDARVDSRKFKDCFALKAKMLAPKEVLEQTGHAVGGVCPFALKDSYTQVYMDISLRRFETVFPACGSSNSAIELDCEELFRYSQSLAWVDVCKDWQAAAS